MDINLDYLKEKKELVSVILLGGSALLIVLIFMKVTGFFVEIAQDKNIIASAIMQNKQNPEDIDKILAQEQTLADELSRNNLFAPQIQEQVIQTEEVRQFPITEIRGILGKSVLINGQWYSVGSRVQNATIQSISPSGLYATIEFNGETRDFSPLDASVIVSQNQTGMTMGMTNIMGGGISSSNINSLITDFMDRSGSDIINRLTGGGMMGGRGGMGGFGGGGGRGDGGGGGGGRGGGRGGRG